ncbi:MAG: CPBP family intramembrane glutamic endopeptidase [Candidatus Thorarchaeota archaeon]
MTTTPKMQPSTPDIEGSKQNISKFGLLPLALFMLLIGTIWRIVDIGILDLGSTWLNILPSKLFPLLILLYTLRKYYTEGLSDILGLSSSNFKSHLIIGIGIGLSFFLIIDAGITILYASFVNPLYPTYITVVNPDLILYSCSFFFINAVYEETLFRGMLQNSFAKHTSSARAILYSALIFGVWHAFWPLVSGASLTEGITLVLFSAILGGFFGIYYEKFASRKSLIGPIAAHTLINFLREGFKVGPVPQIQGPDVSITNPELFGIMAVGFLLLFAIYYVLSYKFRVESIENTGNSLKKLVLNRHANDGESSFKTKPHLKKTIRSY